MASKIETYDDLRTGEMVISMTDEDGVSKVWHIAKESVMGVGKGSPSYGSDLQKQSDDYMNMMRTQQSLQAREWALQYAKSYVAQEVWLLREEMLDDMMGGAS